MSARAEPIETIESTAAGWFALQRSGEVTSREAADFEAWVAEPAHRAAYDAVARSWESVELARTAPEIMALRAEARRRPAVERRTMFTRIAAGFVALALVGGLGLWAGEESGFARSRSLQTQTYRTGLGERSTFALPDGSVVTLNTDTVLRTRADRDRRLLYLDKGQAFFRVAKDRRHPFMVAAAGRMVTAVGTAFDVRVDGKQFEVVLVEGKVKVDNLAPAPAVTGAAGPAPVQSTEMIAGDRLVASTETRAWAVAPTDTAKETSWLTGWLNFENERLADVAAEFNRYSPRKIIVADAELADTPVSGRFEADDVEAFTRALAKYQIARVDSAGPDAIHLAAPE
jgi:transmembrane sensor